jgi:hypothetical protein
VTVIYRDVEIPGQRVDLIVEGLVVVELKSDDELACGSADEFQSADASGGLAKNSVVRFSCPS